ncbi:uroporphyrinogen-III synthase [Virgibacillus xinjiangensis]|uniref:Uroporphyrinogen-III synthase n=1 Tax=Virgibacillus xinjiangensis TaxID=393090 RepID=A0ABV7CUC3_9BACI
MAVSLKGKKILVTREEHQAKTLADKVKRLEGIPVTVPLLKITCKDCKDNRKILERLQTIEWIFFTSANGVHCFFQTLKQDKELSMQGIKTAVVGHKTEAALASYGFTADFVPSIYDAKAMGNEFLNRYANPGPILLVRGNRSRNVLPDTFSALGIPFEMVEVYDTSLNLQMKQVLQEKLRLENIDILTFTSPSAVEAFCEMTPNRETPCICIGSTTKKRAEEMGFYEVLSPEVFTTDSMLELISDYIAGKDGL